MLVNHCWRQRLVLRVLISAFGLERRCGACDGYGVDGVIVMVLLGFDHERKNKKEEEEKKEETIKVRKKK